MNILCIRSCSLTTSAAFPFHAEPPSSLLNFLTMANQAAWLRAKGAQLHVEKAPYPSLEPGHIIIKNAAVAINHIDWKVQDSGSYVKSWPTILGHDTAGEVVEIGEGVANIRKGQRVIGYCLPLASGKSQEGAFQSYVSVPAVLAVPIPDSMTFVEASVLPLSISTAAAGLYQADILHLPYPTENPEETRAIILVWGGSSSVGSSVIQLAVASGLNVISTASPRSFDLVKTLGAESVLDYTSPDITDDLIKVLKGKKLVGIYDCIGLPQTTSVCAEVLAYFGGGTMATVDGLLEELPSDVTAVKGE